MARLCCRVHTLTDGIDKIMALKLEEEMLKESEAAVTPLPAPTFTPAFEETVATENPSPTPQAAQVHCL